MDQDGQPHTDPKSGGPGWMAAADGEGLHPCLFYALLGQEIDDDDDDDESTPYNKLEHINLKMYLLTLHDL